MKKIFIASLAAVAALVSCQKNVLETVDVFELRNVDLTIGASPVVPAGRTAISYDEGKNVYTPTWEADDAIGVFFNTVSGTPVTLTNSEAGATASFTGTAEVSLKVGQNDFYAYYPSSVFSGIEDGSAKKVSFWIPEVQNVPAGSFDPSADILLAKTSFAYSSGNSVSIQDIAFKRQLSVIKLTVTNTDDLLSEDVVSSLKLTSSAAKLAGKYTVDLSALTGVIDETYYVNSITANLETPVALDSELTVFLLVNPATIASGTTLDLELTTDSHKICRKSIPVTSDIVLQAGHVKPVTFAFPDATSDIYLYSTSPETAMKMTNLGDNRYTWEGMIEGQTAPFLTEFKLCTDKNHYWSSYFRSTKGSSYWSIAKEYEDANMFSMADQGYITGEYTINADLNDWIVEIVPHVWVNGGNTMAGWDRANAFPMTYQGNGILTYEGWFWSGAGGIQLLTNNSLGYNTLYQATKTSDNSWAVSNGLDWQVATLADYNLPDGQYLLTLDTINWTLRIEPVTE